MFSKLKLLKKRREWRKRNPHNFTTLVRSIESFDCVKVGRYTYGPISIHTAAVQPRIQIGDFCSIAGDVAFFTAIEHPTNHFSTYPFKVMALKSASREAISKGGIAVGDDVWIGYGAKIMDGVTIGRGAIVAAGAVVTSNVPPYAIVGGVPAKVLKYRFGPDLIRRLMEVDFAQINDAFILENEKLLYENFSDEIYRDLFGGLSG